MGCCRSNATNCRKSCTSIPSLSLTPALTSCSQFPINKPVTPEALKAAWSEVVTFDDEATYPTSGAESFESVSDSLLLRWPRTDDFDPKIMGNFGNEDEEVADYSDPADPAIVAEAKQIPVELSEYVFTERDVALYNLGIGATAQEVQYTFEGDEDFQALPTFGVIPQFGSSTSIPRQSNLRFDFGKMLILVISQSTGFPTSRR